MSSENPLKNLVVDAINVDRDKLAGLLKGRVGLDPDRQRIVFLPGTKSNATVRQTVAYALLGQRALSLLADDEGVADDISDGLTPAQLSEVTGISGGSIRPALKELREEGLVERLAGGNYRVVVPALDRFEVLLS